MVDMFLSDLREEVSTTWLAADGGTTWAADDVLCAINWAERTLQRFNRGEITTAEAAVLSDELWYDYYNERDSTTQKVWEYVHLQLLS